MGDSGINIFQYTCITEKRKYLFRGCLSFLFLNFRCKNTERNAWVLSDEPRPLKGYTAVSVCVCLCVYACMCADVTCGQLPHNFSSLDKCLMVEDKPPDMSNDLQTHTERERAASLTESTTDRGTDDSATDFNPSILANY